MSLPKSVNEMSSRLGIVYGLNGLKKASHQLADWVLEAAERRWGESWRDHAEDVWDNAVELWGDEVVTLRDRLIAIERGILEKGGPLA